MSVMLDKLTDGYRAVSSAVGQHGDGIKFVTMRQTVNASLAELSAEVVYRSDESGRILYPREQLAGITGLADAALHRGVGVLVVVTVRGQHAPILVSRFRLQDGRAVTATRHAWDRYGQWDDAHAQATRQLYAADDTDRARVAAIMRPRWDERAALRASLINRPHGA